MKRVVFALTLLLLTVSCRKDIQERMDDLLKVNLGFAVTKLSDTAYEYGDEAGVFMDGLYNNVKMSYDGRWTASEQMYWPDKETPQDFFAYAPYSVSAGISPMNFLVKADQSALTDYKSSDLVWGSLTGSITSNTRVTSSFSRYALI